MVRGGKGRTRINTEQALGTSVRMAVMHDPGGLLQRRCRSRVANKAEMEAISALMEKG